MLLDDSGIGLGSPHVVQLEGRYTARFGEVSYTSPHGRFVRNEHDPIPVLVRRLIAEGFISRDDPVEVRRGDTVSFLPVPAKRWADVDIVDHDTTGFRTHKAYIGPHAPGAAQRAQLLASLSAQKAISVCDGSALEAGDGTSEGNDKPDTLSGSSHVPSAEVEVAHAA